MLEKTTDFGRIVQLIREGEILLPDFQRNFVWKEEKKQIGIIASVLAKIPVGSILLLEGQTGEFACRKTGLKEYVIPEKEKAYFLLDGQQRVTVLSMAFSTVIHEAAAETKELSDKSLARRFFLRIPKWKAEPEERNLFGAWNLNFPLIHAEDEPDFLTDEIRQDIICLGCGEKPGNILRMGKPDLTWVLNNWCMSKDDDFFYIPLYLLVEPDNGDRFERALRKILQSISDCIGEDISDFAEELKEKERQKFYREILNRESLYDIGREEMITGEKFRDCLDEQKRSWESKMKEYLFSCVKQMKMNQIQVANSKRDRAIDIYENLNMGGVVLKTFDLIMAKAAKAGPEKSFYDRMLTYMTKGRDYPVSCVSDRIRVFLQRRLNDEKYCAALNMECCKEEEINAVYQDAFLNVLSLYCHTLKYGEEKLSVDLIKRKKILELQPEQINGELETVCDALDRACFFLQMRCGIRSINEVHYKMMLVLLAYLFTDEERYRKREIHELLEAWYWCVMFSGEFDKDQNVRMVANLNALLMTINEPDRVEWIEKMEKDVFNNPDFSSEEFLLLKDMGRNQHYPKEVVTKTICQFFLSATYDDLIRSDAQPERIHILMDRVDKLQMHHVIPLATVAKMGDSSKELRKQKDCILNSPLNYVYITEKSNQFISCKSVRDYESSIWEASVEPLCFTQILLDGRDKEAILSGRFKAIKSKVLDRIQLCMQMWR